MNRKDLIALVADKNMETALQGILERPKALGIHPITFDIFVHPERDPGVLRRAHDFLRPYAGGYRYGLVMFDYQGCGDEREISVLQNEVQQRLNESGWQERSRVIILNPELEVWVWSDSPHVATIFGFNSRSELDAFLQEQEVAFSSHGKPLQPKEAMETALRENKIPRSSSLYHELAQKVSLKRCVEPSFAQLKKTLRQWFPEKEVRP